MYTVRSKLALTYALTSEAMGFVLLKQSEPALLTIRGFDFLNLFDSYICVAPPSAGLAGAPGLSAASGPGGWYTPPLVEGAMCPQTPTATAERERVMARDMQVLKAMYFSRNLIPESPTEPDPMAAPAERRDPIIVPLTDVCPLLD